MARKENKKAGTDVLKGLIILLLVWALVFFFILPSASAASETAGTELESQPEDEDEEEGFPWVVVIVGIMVGMMTFLLTWFRFKRARGEISLFECWVTPSEPLVGEATELKVILENTGPLLPLGEHDVGVDMYEEFEVIEKIKSGSFSLETGRKTELLVTWVPEIIGERKITVIITQGGVEVDMYSFSKTVGEE